MTLDDLQPYLDRGWSLIPIDPKSKKPLIEWKQMQEHRASIPQIQAWLREWPDMKVGVVTGAVSGIVVVDVDTKDVNEQRLFEMSPSVVSTPHGYHVYFAHPGQVVKNGVRVDNHTDIRGDGGYVVLPPSTGYSWLGEGVAPDKPLDKLPSRFTEPRAKASAPASQAQEGERDVRFFKRASLMRRLNVPKEMAWEILQREYVGLAEKDGFLPEDVRKCLESAYSRYEPKDRTLRIQSVKAMTAEAIPPTEWLVPDLVPTASIVMLLGKPKKGKSILATQIGLAITQEARLWDDKAKMSDISNRKDSGVYVEGGAEVLHLALEEGSSLFARRIQKQLGGRGTHHDRYWVSSSGPILISDLDILLHDWMLEHPRTRLVTIDPLVNIRPDQEDRNPYVREYNLIGAMRRVVDEYGISFLLVHHARKGGAEEITDASLSTSGLPGAMDLTVLLERERQDKRAVLRCEGRVGKGGEWALEFDESRLRWVRIGEAEKVQAQEKSERDDERAQRLNEYSVGKIITLTEAQHFLGCRRSDVYQRLEGLGYVQVRRGQWARRTTPTE